MVIEKNEKRQKLNLTEHDIFKYLIDYSSVNHKVSINDIAEYFTALTELAAANKINDFHELDEELTGEPAELKKSGKAVINDSVRIQVRRLLSKYLNKKIVGNIRIKCGSPGKVKSNEKEFYADTPFSESEIVMIRDAISFFPYAEPKVTEKIVDSLNLFTPKSNRQEYCAEIVSADKYPGSYYENLSEIHKAFAEYYENAAFKKSGKNPGRKKPGTIKKLSFKYCRYNVNKKLEVYVSSSGSETRIVNPVKTMWSNGLYYLVTFEFDPKEKKPCFRNYRIDRMREVKCLDENADSLKNYFTGKKKQTYELWSIMNQSNGESKMPRVSSELVQDALAMDASGFSVSDYKKASPIMYSHDILPVIRIKCKMSIMNNAIDTFGFDFETEKCGDDEFIMTLRNTAAGGVKMWALEYGDQCEIIEPAALRASVAETVKRMNEKYSGK